MNALTPFAPLVAHHADNHRIMFAAPDGRPVMAVCRGGHERQFTADEMGEIRRRTVACWNAFGDMPTELIEDMQGDLVEVMASTEDELQQLTDQRDGLLAALRLIQAAEPSAHDLAYCKGIAQAAISKVEGLL